MVFFCNWIIVPSRSYHFCIRKMKVATPLENFNPNSNIHKLTLISQKTITSCVNFFKLISSMKQLSELKNLQVPNTEVSYENKNYVQ